MSTSHTPRIGTKIEGGTTYTVEATRSAAGDTPSTFSAPNQTNTTPTATRNAGILHRSITDAMVASSASNRSRYDEKRSLSSRLEVAMRYYTCGLDGLKPFYVPIDRVRSP